MQYITIQLVERWPTQLTTNIGTMYLVFAIIAGLIGSAFSVLMRMELMHPGDEF